MKAAGGKAELVPGRVKWMRAAKKSAEAAEAATA